MLLSKFQKCRDRAYAFYKYCIFNKVTLSRWYGRLNPEDQKNRKPDDQKMTKWPKLQKTGRPEKMNSTA